MTKPEIALLAANRAAVLKYFVIELVAVDGWGETGWPQCQQSPVLTGYSRSSPSFCY